MLFRNLASMDVEESIRANPIDGVVLLVGCDKTTPALLMGATSMNLPAIYLPAGPMLNSHWRDQTLGSGSDTWKYWDELRAGRISENDWKEIEDTISRSPGTCMTMGTAATMMSLAEALGFTLPGYSSIPAPDSNHARMATLTGKRIVEMVWEDLKPRDILSRGSFDNAITTLMAMGGSTNAIVHLVAMAGRAGLSFPLERYNEISAKVPVIANVRPSGKKYLMEMALHAKFSIVKASKGDTHGNLVFEKTTKNFSTSMAKAGDITIAEVEELVQPGELNPDEITVAGIYVHRIFQGTNYEKRIERRTVALK